MTLARVFVIEDNDFDLDLMTDLIACNDLQAVTPCGVSWIDEASGPAAGDVVVVDLDAKGGRGREVVKRLHRKPRSERPRIVGLAQAGVLPETDDCAEVLTRPLDIGGFARAVVRHSREANLD